MSDDHIQIEPRRVIVTTAAGFGEYSADRYREAIARGAELLIIAEALPNNAMDTAPDKTVVTINPMPHYWLLKAAEVLVNVSMQTVGARPTIVELCRCILANLVEFHSIDDPVAARKERAKEMCRNIIPALEAALAEANELLGER